MTVWSLINDYEKLDIPETIGAAPQYIQTAELAAEQPPSPSSQSKGPSLPGGSQSGKVNTNERFPTGKALRHQSSL
jgi:hypothetical protein